MGGMDMTPPIVRSNDCPVCGDDTGVLCQRCSRRVLADNLPYLVIVLAIIVLAVAIKVAR